MGKYLEETNKNENTNTVNGDKENKRTNSEELNQTSMDKRIEELYQEELEKDIIKKLEEQGYSVNNIEVEAKILKNNESNNDDETGIKKIKIELEKKIEENKNKQEETLEDKIVTGVQRVKEIDISTKKSQERKDEGNEEDEKNNNITNNDIQNVKKIIIEEYGVSEKCLEIK